VGARSAGGGTPGRGEAGTDSAGAKIKAATSIVAGLKRITAAPDPDAPFSPARGSLDIPAPRGLAFDCEQIVW